MVYARHVRHSDRKKVRYAHDLLNFVKAQNARLATAAAKSVATLNLGATPQDTQTVVINGKTYTFQTTLTEADGHVLIGASATVAATNLFHAINKSGGTAGTDYANAMVANADFVATNPSAGKVTITAKVAGAAGNKALSSTVTSGTWDHAPSVGGAAATTFDTLASLKKNSAEEIAKASSATQLK